MDPSPPRPQTETSPGRGPAHGPTRHPGDSNANRWLLGAAIVALLGVALFGFQPDYLVISPGSALPIEDHVTIGTTPDEIDGDFRLTTVRFARPNLLALLGSWFDSDTHLVDRETLIPEDVSKEEFDRFQQQLFTESEQAAAAVGLGAAGFDVEVSGEGARVGGVIPDSPAEDVLRPDDVITAVDGETVELASQLVTMIRSRSAGDRVELTVRRDGSEETLSVTLEEVEQIGQPGLGVTIATVDRQISLPFEVDIDQGSIGGPSAGLMMALAVFDLADPGDLAAGRNVVGTGTIDFQGNVGPVGSVRQKVKAARSSGADVFLVPADSVDVARAAAGDALEVIPVETFEDALGALGADTS